jgi:hypothetical protein
MADRDIFKLLEPIMVFGVIAVVLIWQWLSIRAEIARDRRKTVDEANPPS